MVLERTGERDGLVCRDGEGEADGGHHVGHQEDVGHPGLINYQQAAESLKGEKEVGDCEGEEEERGGGGEAVRPADHHQLLVLPLPAGKFQNFYKTFFN